MLFICFDDAIEVVVFNVAAHADVFSFRLPRVISKYVTEFTAIGRTTPQRAILKTER